MKQLVFLFALIGLTACSGSGGGSSVSAEEQVYGEWYYENPNSTSTSARGIVAKIEANGNVQMMNVYAYGNANSVTAYVRKNVGTFTRTGEQFDTTWTYETCNPVQRETIYLKIQSNGQLRVSNADRSVEINMVRDSGKSTIKSLAVVEDKNCNILSKLEKESKRIPASAKSPSFFDRVLK